MRKNLAKFFWLNFPTVPKKFAALFWDCLEDFARVNLSWEVFKFWTQSLKRGCLDWDFGWKFWDLNLWIEKVTCLSPIKTLFRWIFDFSTIFHQKFSESSRQFQHFKTFHAKIKLLYKFLKFLLTVFSNCTKKYKIKTTIDRTMNLNEWKAFLYKLWKWNTVGCQSVS